jgi:hypothetical protein
MKLKIPVKFIFLNRAVVSVLLLTLSGCDIFFASRNGPSCPWDTGTCVDLVSTDPDALSEFENWCANNNAEYSIFGCDPETYDLPETGACNYPGTRAGLSESVIIAIQYDSTSTYGIYFTYSYYSNSIEDWEAACIADGGDWKPPMIIL